MGVARGFSAIPVERPRYIPLMPSPPPGFDRFSDAPRPGGAAGPGPGGDDTTRAWRLASMGTELVAGVAGMAVFGYLLDMWLKTSPWALIGGAVAGVLGAGYNFLRRATREGREAAERYAREHPGGVSSGARGGPGVAAKKAGADQSRRGASGDAAGAAVFPMTAAEQKDLEWEAKWGDGYKPEGNAGDHGHDGGSHGGEGGGGDGGGGGGGSGD